MTVLTASSFDWVLAYTASVVRFIQLIAFLFFPNCKSSFASYVVRSSERSRSFLCCSFCRPPLALLSNGRPLRTGNDNHRESNNNNLQLSPSANNLHLHVHNQLSGSSLATNDNSSASYSSTLDLHHKVNMSFEHFSNSNSFTPRQTPPHGMLQNLFKNLRQKSKYCFLMNLKQANQAFMRKVPQGAEADNILGKALLSQPNKVRKRSKTLNLFSPLSLSLSLSLSLGPSRRS